MWISPLAKSPPIIIFHYYNHHYYHYCSINKDFIKPYSSKEDIKLKYLNLYASFGNIRQMNFKTNKKNKTFYLHELELGAYAKPTTKYSVQSAPTSLLFLKYF